MTDNNFKNFVDSFKDEWGKSSDLSVEVAALVQIIRLAVDGIQGNASAYDTLRAIRAMCDLAIQMESEHPA